MKPLLQIGPNVVLALGMATAVHAQGRIAHADAAFQWVAFPDSAKFKVLGLPWIEENGTRLWRVPAQDIETLPKGVQARSKCPSGGRILLKCNTSRLAVRVVAANDVAARRFDTYVNGRLCEAPSAQVTKRDQEHIEFELVLFQDLDNREKEILIYLPHLQEVAVKALGVDQATRFSTPERTFARALPVVFYGSSVCQGSGAVHPGQSYPAIVSRELNLDFVNLGFGGAGKAETNVVDLVKSIPACCYVFDLGKSYGAQDASAFHAMLHSIRQRHPEIPIIAITPITSVKEVKEPSYSERSIHTRTVMRDAVMKRIGEGDRQLQLINGEDLLGFKEHHALSKDGVHPSDQGYRLIATKLAPKLKQALRL